MLDVRGLTVHYGEIQALRDVSFKVADGQVVSVIGANGGGKTTMMKALMGLLPARGEVFMHGDNITSLSCYQRVNHGMALVPEGRHVFPELTVRENIVVGAYAQRKHKKQWIEDLDGVIELFPNLKDRLEQRAGSLSGGEQQMLAIARGLMSRPRLLMLDEPALGLAPIVIQDLGRVVLRIKSAGTTVILAEQNASLAMKVADYVYLLQVGQIVQEGNPEDLREDDRVKKAYFGG